MGEHTSVQVRFAIECFLLVMADSFLTASDDSQDFYHSEIQQWSQRLHTVLERLYNDSAFYSPPEGESNEEVTSETDGVSSKKEPVTAV